jgi:hypothetical protein
MTIEAGKAGDVIVIAPRRAYRQQRRCFDKDRNAEGHRRTPISTTRALSLNTAKFILLGSQPLVEGSLDHVSLNHIIPIVATEPERHDLLGS